MAVACALYAGIYGALGLLRYATYHSRSLDMAYYVRLVWGMAHGHPDNPVVGAPHWLGLHLEPVLLPVAWVIRAAGLPVAETLLVLQALGAALALIPIHSLARRRLAPLFGEASGEAAALAAALTIYLLPAVSRCLDYDFHPSTLLIAPLAAWIDSVDGGRYRRAWLWLAVCLAFREDVGLQVAAAAVTFVALPTAASPKARREQRRVLGAQALLGAAWFSIYALEIQPRFLPDPADGSFGAHFERFGGGAGGVAGVLAAALSQPRALLSYLVSGDRPWYPPALLATVGLVALAAPRWLAGALPVMAINLLSDFPGVRRVESHYATAMAPFLAAAAVCGAARLGAWLSPRHPRLRCVPLATLLVAVALSWWTRGAAPGAPDFSLAAYREDDYARAARLEKERLGANPRVIAEVRVLAHVAERPEPLLPVTQRRYWKH